MKKITAILSSELYPKMRHGLTTLAQRQKCRANNGSTLAYPLLRNLTGFIQQGRWWPQLFGIFKGWSWFIILNKVTRWTVHTVQANHGGYARKSQERDVENWLAVFCSCMTTTLHTSHVAKTAATEYGFEILPHPPYSPDMAPSVVYLFPKLKSHLHSMEVMKASTVNEY